jgi:hypothetical protein
MDVAFPQLDLVKLLHERNGIFTILPEMVTVNASIVKIPISFIEYEFRNHREYPVEANLEYDYAAKEWTCRFIS